MVAVVFVALTGARRSGGGGCDDSGGSSSSSSSSNGGFVNGGTSGTDSTSTGTSTSTSSGGTTYDDYTPSSGSYSSSTSSSSSSTSSTPTEPSFEADVTSETTGSNCRYDEATKQLQYDITVRNPASTTTYDYSLTVRWEKSTGGSLMGSDYERVKVAPGQSQTVTMTSYYTFTERTYYTCRVVSASKYKS